MALLKLIDGNVLDQAGRAVPGALVYVYDSNGLASLYDEFEQPISNPVTAGEDGYWSAYVEQERLYTLKYYWAGRLRLTDANRFVGPVPLAVESSAAAEDAKFAAIAARSAAELAEESAETASEAAVVARAGAEVAQAATEARVALIEEVAGATIYPTWTELAAAVGMVAGDTAVIFEDAGTHTDPVTAATVDNAGLYIYRDPTGWERFADASEAARQVAIIEDAATAIEPAKDLLLTRPTSKQVIGNPGDIASFVSTTTTSNDSSHIYSTGTTVNTANGALLVEIKADADGMVYLFTYTGGTSSKTAVGIAGKYLTAGYNRFVMEPSDFVALTAGSTMPVGCFICFVGIGVIGFRTETGAPRWNGSSFASGAVADTNYNHTVDGIIRTNVQFGVKFTLYDNKSSAYASPRQSTGNVLPVGVAETVGSNSIATATGVTTSNWRAHTKRYPNGGYVRAINVNMTSAGPIDIVTYTMGASTLTIHDSVTVNIPSTGVNTGVPVGVIIPPNGVVAVAPKSRVATGSGQWPFGVYANADQNGKTIPRSGYTTAGSKVLIQWEVVEFTAGQADVFARFDQAQKRISSKATLLTSEPTEALVFVGLGQSNMTATGADSGNGGSLPLPQGVAYIWRFGTFVDLANNTDTDFTNTLFTAFAKRMFEKTGAAIYIVNSAVGGSAMTQAASLAQGNWSATGTLRGDHETRWAAAKAYLDTNVSAWQFGGAITWQGEREAAAINSGTSGVSGASWKAGYADFDDWVRTLHGAFIPHGLVRVIFDTTDSAGFQAIRQAQIEVAQERQFTFMAYTGTIDFHARGLMNADGLHANMQGKNEVGYKVAEKMAVLAAGIA